MGCDLRSIYGSLASSLPVGADEEAILSVANVPAASARIATDALVIVRGIHVYDPGFRDDVLLFNGDKLTFACLALLVTSVVFRERSEVTIDLTDRRSDVRRIVVSSGRTHEGVAGYRVRPEALHWAPEPLRTFPFAQQSVDSYSLPAFYLSTEDQLPKLEEWDLRDTLFGFGNHRGCMQLASLLLSFASPSSTIDDIRLESEAGVRGVAPRSCEARFLLPGSFAYVSP